MNEALLENLKKSAKYKDVCEDTIRRIIDEKAPKYKKSKDIEKAVREALHGITSAFMTDTEYKRACKSMEQGAYDDVLSCHASTRERLPRERMKELYDRLFEITGKPESVLDLACGLNPVFLAEYLGKETMITGVDISGQCIRLIRDGLRKENVTAIHADLLLIDSMPKEHFDCALLFKILPLLERQKKGASAALLRAVDAKKYIVSFPTRTLSGRNVGMEEHYTSRLDEYLPEGYCEIGRVDTSNEVYLVIQNKEKYGEAVCGGNTDRKSE